MSGPAKNTDRELYREDTGDSAGSYYENSVHVTAEGAIGMNVGGRVVTLPIADWHALAWPSDTLPPAAAGGDRGDNTERCEAVIWSQSARDWVTCGSPITGRTCSRYGHLYVTAAARPAHADAVMADLGAAITEGGELRDALALPIWGVIVAAADQPTDPSLIAHAAVSAVLATDEMRALLDAAAKVQRCTCKAAL